MNRAICARVSLTTRRALLPPSRARLSRCLRRLERSAVGPVGDFEQQMRTLRRAVTGDAPGVICSTTGQPKLVHITFDDAFRSVANALPVLRELGLPSTIFACSQYARDGGRLSIPRLADGFRRRRDRDHGLGDSARDRRGRPGGDRLARSRPCRSRRALGRRARQELSESKSEIEDHLGRPCATHAYPFGSQDARVRRATATAGYAAAFGAPGVSGHVDPFRIPRTGIWRDEPPLRQRVRTQFMTRLILERRARAS